VIITGQLINAFARQVANAHLIQLVMPEQAHHNRAQGRHTQVGFQGLCEAPRRDPETPFD